ncbi:hypothetical protein [Elizabethkingia meningoseptica]|uniref:hypothetical protein n=1 Tax=Elizabethkingia meningoseptica TaxID=238 RepID=UPI0038927F8A
MTVERRPDNRIYFGRKENPETNNFFNLLIFKKREQLKGRIVPDYKIPANTSTGKTASISMICYTIEITWTWTDEDTGKIISSSTTFETRCRTLGNGFYPLNRTECIEIDCEPSYDYGGGGGSYTPDPPEETPCTSIQKLMQNTQYQKIVQELDRNSVFNKPHETGYSENKSGTFTPLVPGTDKGRDYLTIPINTNTKGYTHTHLNDKETGKITNEDLVEEKKPIRMFSPADVDTLMSIIDLNRTDTDYSPYYGSMISGSGNYMIKFTGTASDIKTGFDTDEWRKKYGDYIRDKKGSLEEKFLNFLRNEMQVSGISLYKIRNNGKKIEEKILSADGKKVGTTKC